LLCTIEIIGDDRAILKLEFANSRDQGAAIITRPVLHPTCRPLPLLGPEGLGHIRFKHLLARRPHQRPQELLIPRQEAFTSIS